LAPLVPLSVTDEKGLAGKQSTSVMLFRRMCGLDLELENHQFVGANIVMYDQCDYNFQFYTLRQYQRLFPNLTHLVLGKNNDSSLFCNSRIVESFSEVKVFG
jgi:hypothetical protein